MKSVFSQEGWEFVYDVRDAVRDGDVTRLRSLANGATETEGQQIGTMALTMLSQYTGLRPDKDTVLVTARVLQRHLERYDPDLPMSVNDFAEVLTAMLHGTPTPTWLDAPAFTSALVGFLMPDDPEAEQRLRADLEPLWARAMEAP